MGTNGFHSPYTHNLRIPSCRLSGSAGAPLGRDPVRNMARSDQSPRSPTPAPAPAPSRSSDPPTAGQGATEPECPVCYDAVATISLNCSHKLCHDCAEQWFRRQPTCPMCREPVDALTPTPDLPVRRRSRGRPRRHRERSTYRPYVITMNEPERQEAARNLFSRDAVSEEYRILVARTARAPQRIAGEGVLQTGLSGGRWSDSFPRGVEGW